MTFVKGQSGNPGGQRKVSEEFRAACRKYTPEAIEAMVQFLQGPDKDYKFRAIEFLMEHGHGKAPQGVDITSNGKDLFDSLLNRPTKADRSEWIAEYNKTLKESLAN